MNSHERKFSWMGRGLIVAAAGLALAMVGPGLGEAVAGSPACPTSITSCGCAITSAGTYTVANDLAASQGMTALGDCIDVSVSGVTLNLEGYYVENDNGNGNEACDLGAAAGFGNHRSPRRTRVDGKGANQPGKDAAGANPDKIAVDIRRLIGVGRKRSGRCRGLHHHDY